jgi:hypothetical protein
MFRTLYGQKPYDHKEDSCQPQPQPIVCFVSLHDLWRRTDFSAERLRERQEAAGIALKS